MTNEPSRDEILVDVVTHQNGWTDAVMAMPEISGVSKVSIIATLAEAARIGSIHSPLLGAKHAHPVLEHVRTGLYLMIAKAPEPTEDMDDRSYWRRELRALDRLDVLLKAEAGIQVELNDWRNTADVEVSDELAKPVAATVMVAPEKITVELADGRSVWIELEGQDLRIMSYAADNDEPVVVKIPAASEETSPEPGI